MPQNVLLSECGCPIDRATQSHDQNLLFPMKFWIKIKVLIMRFHQNKPVAALNSSGITHVAPNPILQCWLSNIKVIYQHSAVFQQHIAAHFQTHFSVVEVQCWSHPLTPSFVCTRQKEEDLSPQMLASNTQCSV